MTEITNVDKSIASLVEVTDAILRGDFNTEFNIDAEGLLKELANKINRMVITLKTVEIPLSSAGDQAPTLVDNALNVVDLMKKTAGQVLDKADKLSELADQLEERLNEGCGEPQGRKKVQAVLDAVKNDIFDIIATQTFQDVARQKMEVIIKDMNQMRDWLIEALVILNIRRNHTPENVQQKTDLLRDVTEPSTPDKTKQDLVDDLLAEFGF